MALMKLTDCTFPEPAMNLACDEALLDLCEAGFDHDVLRFWEPGEHFVVLGYSSRICADVKLPACERAGVPVLRRCSGGGTVLQGPGCLNFSLILRMERRPELESLAATTRWIMQAHRNALAPVVGGEVRIKGYSDLVRDGLKFSGNAQRRKRRAVLFHGSVLLGMDFELLESLLPVPERQPAYRKNRAHRDFAANLNLPAGRIKDALISAWQAKEPLAGLPMERIEALARTTYSTQAWTHKF
jgi:lipoate-protein ligase A